MFKFRTLLEGIGNEYRKDDGVGIYIIRELKKNILDSVTFLEFQGNELDLLQCWQGYPKVYIFDALVSGSTAGTLYRFTIPGEVLPTHLFGRSTHRYNLAECVELARVLNMLPNELMVYGIEGLDFAQGQGLSAPVEKTAQQVIQELQHQLVSERTTIFKST